jgi:hypothetical protein
LWLEEIVIICVVVTVGFIALTNFSNAFSQTGGFSLYNNTDYGIQILYPKGWVAIEGDRTPGDYYTDIVIFEPAGEQGKHFSKKFTCGEVCLGLTIDNALERQGLSLQQYSDVVINDAKKLKGFKLLEYNPTSKIGDKKAFEHLYEKKQGNREYIEKYMGTPLEKNFLILDYKSRTKFSDQTLPLANTMIDSFRFIDNSSKQSN